MSEANGSATIGRRRLLLGVGAATLAPSVSTMMGGFLSPAAGQTSDLPEYAPIPAGSFGPALNANDYFVGRVQGNLYWITDSFYQVMFLSTREGVVLVDAPPTIGHNLLRAIAEVTQANGRPSKVTHLVYSHSHADHIGAASLFGRDVMRIGHRETRRLLREADDPNRPAPNVAFDRSYDLNVGGEHLHLAHHGPNHSPDNIFIYAPRQATLMLVDVLYPGWVPFKNLAVSQDIPGWIKAHDIAMRYPWETLVGGHLGRLGTREDGHLQQEYLRDLDASTREAMALDPTPYFAEYGPAGNAWAIFKTYLDAVATKAAEPVVAMYTGVLGAADVFTVDNAFAVLESLRIDSGILGPFGIRP